MTFEDYMPVWERLSLDERRLLKNSATQRTAKKGTVLHNGSADCVGLFVISSGQLRAFILSDEGKEVTLYRLFERDVCLFSASCIMSSIQFDIVIEVEKDASFWVIPADVYKKLMESSGALANFTNDLMAARFSEVMWLVEQVMWKSFDRRLACFLTEESALEGGDRLELTHERIAAHLGTAREVVTRMLRYFQTEGMVELSRKAVLLTDKKRLLALAES